MTPKQRWLILGSVLLATLLAGYLLEDEPLPETPRRKASAQSPTSSSTLGQRDNDKERRKELALAPLEFPESVSGKAADENGKLIDPFRSKSWYLAPPPPPPPKPMAPPLPFQYLGKLDADGETRVFLNHQGKHLIVKVGDVLAGAYSVEAIAGGRMTLLYQPLKETQVLAIGADK